MAELFNVAYVVTMVSADRKVPPVQGVDWIEFCVRVTSAETAVQAVRRVEGFQDPEKWAVSEVKYWRGEGK